MIALFEMYSTSTTAVLSLVTLGSNIEVDTRRTTSIDRGPIAITDFTMCLTLIYAPLETYNKHIIGSKYVVFFCGSDHWYLCLCIL